MDLGTDPVDGERDEAHADVGIEPADGLHEPDVALLNEVAERKPVTGIAAGHMDHEAQMRQHEALGRIEVVRLAQPGGELELLVGREHRNGIGGLKIVVQAAERAYEHELGRAGR